MKLNNVFLDVIYSTISKLLSLENIIVESDFLSNTNMLISILLVVVVLLLILFTLIINVQKGYTVKMEESKPKESNRGAKKGNKNALVIKEYHTDDDDSDNDDDTKCKGHCKPKIYVPMSDWYECKIKFYKSFKQYYEVNSGRTGLFPSYHDKSLDMVILIKYFIKYRDLYPNLNLKFTKLVNHYIASWEKYPLGNSQLNWVNHGINLERFFDLGNKHLDSGAQLVFSPKGGLKKTSFEEFMIYKKIVDKTIVDCKKKDLCKICKKI